MKARLIAVLLTLSLAILVTGCGKKKVVTPEGDVVPPDPITNLTATVVDTFTVTLHWTAPGDDGANGTAQSYDVRYATRSTVPWASMTPIPSPPTPKPAGAAESLVVHSLAMGGTYYFSIRTLDEASNLSALSNTASAVTPEHEVGADIVVTTEDQGIWYSRNGGLSWHPSIVSDGHSAFGALACDPQKPDTVYASGTPYGIGDAPRLFKSTDGGQRWDPLSVDASFPQNSAISCIAVAPSSPVVLYAGVRGRCLTPATNCQEKAGAVFRSVNGGTTWEDQSGSGASGLPMSSDPAYGHIDIQCLAVNPSYAFRVYAGGSTGLFYSTTGGTNWSPVSPSSGDSILGVAVDPSITTRVLASSAGAGGGVHLSETAGSIWNRRSTHGGRQPIVFVPGSALTVYTSSEKSSDGGQSWSPLALPSGATAGINGLTLAIDGWSATRDVYIAGKQGVWRSSDGGSSWTPLGALSNCAGVVVVKP